MIQTILILTILGISAGIICSTIVIINIIAIKYKDLSNKMIFWLVLNDLLMSIISIFITFGFNDLYCKFMIFFALLLRSIHKFIVFFISYALYKVVVKNELITHKFLAYYIVVSILFSVIQVTFGVIISNPHQYQNYCTAGSNTLTGLIYFITTEYSVTFTILIAISIFFCKIRSSIKEEIKNSNISSVKKRFFAKRLIGFGFVFSFCVMPFVIVNGLGQFHTIDESDAPRELANLFYAWYPLLDSAVYGFTKSFKRNIFNLCWKDPEFETQEEVLYILREQNLLRPRFYLDLTGQSEISMEN